MSSCYVCVLCKATIGNSVESINRHFEEAGHYKKRRFTCNRCDRSYGSRAMLMKHQLDHFSDHSSDGDDDESGSDQDLTGIGHIPPNVRSFMQLSSERDPEERRGRKRKEHLLPHSIAKRMRRSSSLSSIDNDDDDDDDVDQPSTSTNIRRNINQHPLLRSPSSNLSFIDDGDDDNERGSSDSASHHVQSDSDNGRDGIENLSKRNLRCPSWLRSSSSSEDEQPSVVGGRNLRTRCPLWLQSSPSTNSVNSPDANSQDDRYDNNNDDDDDANQLIAGDGGSNPSEDGSSSPSSSSSSNSNHTSDSQASTCSTCSSHTSDSNASTCSTCSSRESSDESLSESSLTGSQSDTPQPMLINNHAPLVPYSISSQSSDDNDDYSDGNDIVVDDEPIHNLEEDHDDDDDDDDDNNYFGDVEDESGESDDEQWDRADYGDRVIRYPGPSLEEYRENRVIEASSTYIISVPPLSHVKGYDGKNEIGIFLLLYFNIGFHGGTKVLS